MKDREYDIAYLEIKLKNDELEREWYLWKLGRRGELVDASKNRRGTETETPDET